MGIYQGHEHYHRTRSMYSEAQPCQHTSLQLCWFHILAMFKYRNRRYSNKETGNLKHRQMTDTTVVALW